MQINAHSSNSEVTQYIRIKIFISVFSCWEQVKRILSGWRNPKMEALEIPHSLQPSFRVYLLNLDHYTVLRPLVTQDMAGFLLPRVSVWLVSKSLFIRLQGESALFCLITKIYIHSCSLLQVKRDCMTVSR